jgi:prepilin-type N-terminal cleavage/methylation domain-containing protein
MSLRRTAAFTLIELLVVIAIIAILAVVVVLTLNPAQLLAESRDANRVSDLATLNRGIALYMTDQSNVPSYSIGVPSTTYISIPDNSSVCGNSGIASSSFPYHCSSPEYYRNASSSGWLPIDFNNISSGSPFGAVPTDPINSTSSDLYYVYNTNGAVYTLNAVMESEKYAAEPSANRGNDPALLEMGPGALTLPDAGRGLVGYWPLDDASGNIAADISGNGYAAALNGAPSWVAGKIGGALQFNGSNYAGTSLSWPSSAGSVALWAYPTAYNSWVGPVGWKYAASSGGYILIDEGGNGGTGNWRGVFNPGGTSEADVVSSVPIAQNQWTYLVFTWNFSGTTASTALYVNGALIGTATWSGTPSSNIGPFYMGTTGQAVNNDFTGKVDDVRVYDRALSGAEILQMYNAEKNSG